VLLARSCLFETYVLDPPISFSWKFSPVSAFPVCLLVVEWTVLFPLRLCLFGAFVSVGPPIGFGVAPEVFFFPDFFDLVFFVGMLLSCLFRWG